MYTHCIPFKIENISSIEWIMLFGGPAKNTANKQKKNQQHQLRMIYGLRTQNIIWVLLAVSI